METHGVPLAAWHAFKVFCYHRQSWTWDEYCIWIGIPDTAQVYSFRQEVGVMITLLIARRFVEAVALVAAS